MPGSDSPPPSASRSGPRGPGEPTAPGAVAAPSSVVDPGRGASGAPGASGAAGSPSEAGEPADRLYQRALELTAVVAALADNLEVARFHVRDRLDRGATQLALLCHHAAVERAPAARRRTYRDARPYAHECTALLDIIGLRLRRAGGDAKLATDAQALLAGITAALDHLAAR